MSDEGDRGQEIMEKLKRQRDELRLKIHLGKAEARDEWDEMEDKWKSLKERIKAATDEASGAGGEIGSAARDLASELKKGYARIKDQL